MKIKLYNIGPIRQAEFELGKITIICGKNNTGKTYATYATYGLLEFIQSSSEFKIEKDDLKKLSEKGSCIISLEKYISQIQYYIDKSSDKYSGFIHKVFAGKESHFQKAKINLLINNNDSHENKEYLNIPSSVFFGKTRNSRLDITLQDNNVVFTLASNNEKGIVPDFLLARAMRDTIGAAILARFIPRVHIVSAERTGAAIFQRELDFTKNRVLDILQEEKPCSTNELVDLIFSGTFTAKYPLAVRENVDFMRVLSNMTDEESDLSKQHPEILQFLEEIIGGTYEVNKDNEIIFVFKRKKIPFIESSSSAKTLAHLFFYIKYIIKKHDLLIIDEPELNLHPSNQRLIARLFAKLANAGVSVFITTHSDYIIKEINNLILFNKKTDRLRQLAQNNGYEESDFIDFNDLRVYMSKVANIQIEGKERKSKNLTLVKAHIDEEGVEVESFDATIISINKLNDDIIDEILFEEYRNGN